MLTTYLRYKIRTSRRSISTINYDFVRRYLDSNNNEALDKLREKEKSKAQLTIKYGVDVTAPHLHLGHAVNLWLMRHFQDCGHRVVFLLGDFTTLIADPTGKSETRPQISQEAINRNANEFTNQIATVLRTEPHLFSIRRNSEWYNAMLIKDFLGLMRMVTHSKLINRDMFQDRINSRKDIHMHELVYPILQGYDSVQLKSDITIVGSDQLYNEGMGKFYQERLHQVPQVVLTTKITPGIDGKAKQSKSLGNYIAITDTPKNKFGKIMSIPDQLIFDYFTIYTTLDLNFINALQEMVYEEKINPMEAKKTLAEAIVERYHGNEIAKKERAWFEDAFSKRKFPDTAEIIDVSINDTLLDIVGKCVKNIMSKTEIKRLIMQRAIKLDNQTITDPQFRVTAPSQMRVGKLKIFKIRPH